MKPLFYICIGTLIILSCDRINKKPTENLNKVEIDVSSNSEFTIDGLNPDDFNTVWKTDTIFYNKQYYEGIDGKIISYNQENFENINARIKFDFSLLQYTIDDNPAYPISYSKETNWIDLECVKGRIIIPHMYGNTNNKSIYEKLNFTSYEELNNWVVLNDFEKIRRESYNEQKTFFRNILNNQTDWECCPEYIDQAKNFLNSDINDYKSIGDLGLELFSKTMTIEIFGYLKNGKKFNKVIIEK